MKEIMMKSCPKCYNQDTRQCRAVQENGARANGSEYINRNTKVAIFTHS